MLRKATELHQPQRKEQQETIVILDSKQLATAIHTADKAKFRRRVDPFFADRLDLFGTHVVGFHIAHTTDINRPVARCQILCKLNDSGQGNHLWLDIDLDVFNRYRRITEDELKEGREMGRF